MYLVVDSFLGRSAQLRDGVGGREVGRIETACAWLALTTSRSDDAATAAAVGAAAAAGS